MSHNLECSSRVRHLFICLLSCRRGARQECVHRDGIVTLSCASGRICIPFETIAAIAHHNFNRTVPPQCLDRKTPASKTSCIGEARQVPSAIASVETAKQDALHLWARSLAGAKDETISPYDATRGHVHALVHHVEISTSVDLSGALTLHLQFFRCMANSVSRVYSFLS